MSDCPHEWAKISIAGDESVFSCLHCGQRLEPGALSSAVIMAEQQLGQTPLVDDIIDPIFIGIPRSESADRDVQRIVDALNHMISRRDQEG